MVLEYRNQWGPKSHLKLFVIMVKVVITMITVTKLNFIVHGDKRRVRPGLGWNASCYVHFILVMVMVVVMVMDVHSFGILMSNNFC